jgi:hypothetical protein
MPEAADRIIAQLIPHNFSELRDEHRDELARSGLEALLEQEIERRAREGGV